MIISIPLWVFPCLLLIVLLTSGRFTPFPRLHYHVRYAVHLWRNVPGMTFLESWRYPFDVTVADGDPIEDADAEIAEMRA